MIPTNFGVLLPILCGLTIVLPGCDIARNQLLVPGVGDFVGHAYSLPRAVTKVTIGRIKTASGSATKLAIEEIQYAPDPFHTYSLTYIKNILQKDDLKIHTDNGLLKLVSATTEDKTRDIISKVIELAKEVGKLSLVDLVIETDPPPSPSPDPFYERNWIIDPTSQADIDYVNQSLKALGEKKFRFRTRRLLETRPSARSSEWRTLEQQGDYEEPVCTEVICYRIVIPVALELIDWRRHAADGTHIPIRSEIAFVPDPDIIGSIKVRRGAFIKKVTKLEFDKGILTATEIDNPSELLGFINIPVDVVKALAAIPSELLHFRVTQFNKGTELINAQRGELEARTALLKAEQDLLEQQAKANSLTCFEGDPNC